MLTKAVIKDIQSLQHKKFRDEQGLFIAEGPKVVMELLLNEKLQVQKIFCLQSWKEAVGSTLSPALQNRLEEVALFELEKITQLNTPNQVLAVFKKPLMETSFEVKGQITILLEDIQDPGNLGTIIRLADWFGVKNIVCSPNTVDVFNSKVVQSTMASIANLNILHTDLEDWLQNNRSIKKVAAVLDGSPVQQQPLSKEVILMIGNESKGLSLSLLHQADLRLTIPRHGNAESLNAAMATAIFLYELNR